MRLNDLKKYGCYTIQGKYRKEVFFFNGEIDCGITPGIHCFISLYINDDGTTPFNVMIDKITYTCEEWLRPATDAEKKAINEKLKEYITALKKCK